MMNQVHSWLPDTNAGNHNMQMQLYDCPLTDHKSYPPLPFLSNLSPLVPPQKT